MKTGTQRCPPGKRIPRPRAAPGCGFVPMPEPGDAVPRLVRGAAGHSVAQGGGGFSALRPFGDQVPLFRGARCSPMEPVGRCAPPGRGNRDPVWGGSGAWMRPAREMACAAPFVPGCFRAPVHPWAGVVPRPVGPGAHPDGQKKGADPRRGTGRGVVLPQAPPGGGVPGVPPYPGGVQAFVCGGLSRIRGGADQAPAPCPSFRRRLARAGGSYRALFPPVVGAGRAEPGGLRPPMLTALQRMGVFPPMRQAV